MKQAAPVSVRITKGPLRRFGKSTRISMISNSVTHLRSYTNSAITDIAGNSALISPVTPRDRRRLCIERRRLRIERRYRRIKWPPRDRRRRCPNADFSTSSADVSASSADIVASNDDCFMMFHNVLRVSCFTSGSQCFTCVSWCFTMFNHLLWCLASRATINVAADRLRDRDNAVGIGVETPQESAITRQKSAITPPKLAMAPQGSSLSPRTWSRDKLRPEWRLE